MKNSRTPNRAQTMRVTVRMPNASLVFLNRSNGLAFIVGRVMSHTTLMAERQILFDPINVGRPKNRRLSQRPATFGTFALQQMASACSVEQNLPAGGYLEAFGDRFPGP